MRLCSHCSTCGEFNKGYDPCRCKRGKKPNASPYVIGTSSGDFRGFKRSFGPGVSINSAKDVDDHLKSKGMVLADSAHQRGIGKVDRKEPEWDKFAEELGSSGLDALAATAKESK